jgi:crotonobetaine/carnitine-CoA ligase
LILGLLQKWAQQTPQAPFIVTNHGQYSYAQIHSMVLRFASRLAAQGIGAREHVALIADNSAAYIVAWLGINAVGGVAVTLNNKLLGQSIDYAIGQSDAKLLVVDASWANARLQHLSDERRQMPRIEIQSETAFLATLEGCEERAAVDNAGGDLCTILYTSGTTGLPKGVMCAHAGYVAVGRETARILELQPHDRTFIFLPLFHTNPQMYGVMSALVVGSSLALQERFSAQVFFSSAERLGATGCTFVGTVLAILAARFTEPQRNHRMRFCIGGGTTRELAEVVKERFGMHVHELYGMTEVGGWVSGATVAEHRPGANGLVRGDMDVRIFDADDNELQPGVRGEIVVRPKQPHLMIMGYYNKHHQMVEASRNFWFHTGDIGSFDADGYLYFHGRSKELIRRGGEMVSPQELEERLRGMDGVDDCAIVGIADPIMGEEIKAVVVARASLTADAVVAFLQQHVPAYMLPRYVEFAERIPRTETEKILRRELQYIDERVMDLGRRPGPG